MPAIPSRLTEQLERVIQDLGIYDGSAHEPTPLVQRLLPYNLLADVDAVRQGLISQNELNAHIPPPVVEALFMSLITVPGAVLLPQYEVFDRFPASILINFNNDNLADAVHARHLHLRPHGVIDPRIVHSPAVARALQWLAISERFTRQFDYHRPLPEPSDMTSRLPYRILIREFETAAVVVIIGYSFGEQAATGSLADIESFELFTDLLRRRPRRVLVIGPNPEGLVYKIESAVRRRAVSALRCRWNVLAEFILTGLYDRARKLPENRGRAILNSEYWRFEDAVITAASAGLRGLRSDAGIYQLPRRLSWRGWSPRNVAR